MTPRMTLSTQLVLRALLADPTAEYYGAEIGDAAGLMSGTVHPILARLESIAWVESRWEELDTRAAGRPARRYYRITATGAEQARNELARIRQPQPGRLAPHPLPGTSS
ncbi:helix-turn-helix transcriptional regulator [Dermatophilaceae bacterium Soc4.6]